MKLKVKTDYSDRTGLYGYKTFDVVDKLPEKGDTYKSETVTCTYSSRVGWFDKAVRSYNFYEVITVDDSDNRTTWNVAVKKDLEREYYESMCGMYWDELEDEEQEHLMKSAKVLDSHTTQAMKNAGICMIGFDYDLCTTGCTETDEDGNITFHVFEDAEIGTIPRRYIIK